MSVSHSERTRRLFLADRFQGHWQLVIGPWLHRHAVTAWQHELPVVALVPTRNYGWFVRSRLVDEGVNFAGIQFWTLVDLRAHLLARFPKVKGTLPREHLHLLLAVAAESVAAKDPANRSAAAVASAPAALLRTIDHLAAAGWSFDDAVLPMLRPVARLWSEMLDSAGVQTLQQIDRQLEQLCRTTAPAIESLLVVGFDAAHWPQWPMISAAIHTSRQTDYCLFAPRSEAEDLDQAWIGLAEEKFGEYQQLDASEDSASANTSAAFYLAETPLAEARAIVAATLRFLAEPDCRRLGIVLPSGGVLAREVSIILQEVGVHHNDAFGHQRPGPFEQPDWQSWLALQSMPGLDNLLQFLQQFDPARCKWWPVRDNGAPLGFEQIKELLGSAFRDVLFDDLNVLGAFLRQSRSADGSRVFCGHLLQSIAILPEAGTFTGFSEATSAALTVLGWDDRANYLREKMAVLGPLLKVPFSRSAWLQWLREIAVSTEWQRQPLGGEFYSRVHLVGYADAERQTWSHLVLSGLAEGVWPPNFEDASYLNWQEIARLNQSIRRLNTHIGQQGSQGEGHVSVAPGKGICLGAAERRQLIDRGFRNLIESPKSGIAFTAGLGETLGTGLVKNPGEFFSRVFGEQNGVPLGAEKIDELIGQTAASVRALPAPPADAVDRRNLKPTLKAWQERRNPASTFGPYEFSRAKLPEQPLVLPSSEWEKAIANPAIAWMKAELGVTPVDDIELMGSFSWAIGSWAHQWLAAMARSRGWNERPFNPNESLARVERAAEDMRREMRALFSSVGLSLPLWWELIWRRARYIAGEFYSACISRKEWRYFATEYRLADDFAARVGESDLLRISGRIDLLLGNDDNPPRVRTPDECWIVDYKTGSSRGLKVYELRRGRGIQLALYALAIREQGAQKVGLCLLRPGDDFTDQITLEEILAEKPLWSELVRMQDNSCFGMYGKLRARFGTGARYPLATLEIDEDLLAEKWEKTHPAWKELARVDY